MPKAKVAGQGQKELNFDVRLPKGLLQCQAANCTDCNIPVVRGVYRAWAGHPLEPGQEASQVPGGDNSGEAAPNEPLPSLLGGQLDQLTVPKAHSCTIRLRQLLSHLTQHLNKR